MAGPSATGNFAQAGIAAARENERLLKATLENSPNMGEIVQKAHVRQGKENIASMKAEAKVSTAAINQYAATKTKKTLMDAEDNYKGEVRKAGILAGAGKLVGAGLLGLGQEKSKKREVGAYSSIYKEMMDSNTAKAEELRRRAGELTLPTSSGSTTSTNDTSTGGSGGSKASGSGDLSMQYMEKLTGSGMSDEQAAATVGHLIVETGGFKHMEELAPNVHGTKGYGHLQWTDPTPGKGRRTDFMNWSKSNNLDPQSFDANSGFLIHELTTNFNQSWTGGGSFEGLQKTGSLADASSYLQTNFIRPGVPHTERRLAEGQNVLTQWRNYNSGN